MAMSLFSGGYLPLDQRSLAENLFWAICRKMQRLVAAARLRARGSARARRAAERDVFLQLLAVPVDARQLGHQATVSGDADPSAERAADAPRRAGRHHLRFGRQDRLSSSIAAT